MHEDAIRLLEDRIKALDVSISNARERAEYADKMLCDASDEVDALTATRGKYNETLQHLTADSTTSRIMRDLESWHDRFILDTRQDSTVPPNEETYLLNPQLRAARRATAKKLIQTKPARRRSRNLRGGHHKGSAEA